LQQEGVKMGEYAGEPIHRVEVPPHTLKEEASEALLPVRDLLVNDDDPFRKYRGASLAQKVKLTLFDVIPMLSWISTYKREYIIKDIIAGLTIASLAVPQDIGYSSLANLPAVNGLCKPSQSWLPSLPLFCTSSP
jgi:high affinity sulfate transporter 1